MGIFSGLEKFGFKSEPDGNVDLFDNNAQKEKEAAEKQQKTVEPERIPEESEFLLDKTMRCVVCDKVFKTKVVKSGRVKRMEPDQDLRPRHMYIDTLKYDTHSCPYCGYTAINRYFEHLTSGQIKLVRENICSNFQADVVVLDGTYDYERAIDTHKLSLFNSIAKKAKNSEKAYNCLIISWLMRAQREQLEGDGSEMEEQRAAIKQEEDMFYQQAYEGLMKAVSTELFPICGMDQSTMDYLLAAMSFRLKKYDVASKSLSNVLTSASATRKMKDKALELKDEIIAELKKNR